MLLSYEKNFFQNLPIPNKTGSYPSLETICTYNTDAIISLKKFFLSKPSFKFTKCKPVQSEFAIKKVRQ